MVTLALLPQIVLKTEQAGADGTWNAGLQEAGKVVLCGHEIKTALQSIAPCHF